MKNTLKLLAISVLATACLGGSDGGGGGVAEQVP